MEQTKEQKQLEAREKKFSNENKFAKIGCDSADGWTYNLLVLDKQTNTIKIICRHCWKMKFYFPIGEKMASKLIGGDKNDI